MWRVHRRRCVDVCRMKYAFGARVRELRVALLWLCQIPGIGVEALEVAAEQAATSCYNAGLSCGESLPLVPIKSLLHIIALLLLRR
jgi:hypothetical protein